MKKTDTKRLYELFDEGLANWQIKQRLGLSYTTLHNYRKKHNEENGIIKPKKKKRQDEYP